MSCYSTTTPLRTSPGARPLERGVRTFSSFARALVLLTKPQLAFFSVLTTLAAYATAARGAAPGSVGAVLIGTSLAAGGALSLNQWWERQTDAVMRRTRRRPIPGDAISPRAALIWSLLLSIAGVGFLAIVINLAAALIAAATIVIYGAVYTPLKRRTRWATEIGSISGALPPLIGNAAAGNLAAPAGWLLAALLLCWQMPHFFAIGWKYRADYRAAGFPLLPAIDANGGRTAAWTFGYTLLLLAVSIAPACAGLTGTFYGIVAIAAGGIFLGRAWQFLADREHRDRTAHQLFVTSIIYLPVMMTAVVIDAW